MEEKGFVYVENMQIIMISCNKCQNVLEAQKAVVSDSTLKNHNIDHSNSIRNEDCSLGDSQNSKNIEKQANNQIKNSKNIKNNHNKLPQLVDKQHVMDNLDSLKGNEINELMLRNSYPSFKKSKHTLLMFRKVRFNIMKIILVIFQRVLIMLFLLVYCKQFGDKAN